MKNGQSRRSFSGYLEIPACTGNVLSAPDKMPVIITEEVIEEDVAG